jgi:tetratricopeptide (TPR) repeat protein
MFLAQRRIVDCIGDAEVVIRLAAKRPQGYRLRALCFLADGRLAEAQRDLLHALAIEPDDADTHLTLADCQTALRDFQDALESLRCAERLFKRAGDSDGVAWVGERIRGLLGAR